MHRPIDVPESGLSPTVILLAIFAAVSFAFLAYAAFQIPDEPSLLSDEVASRLEESGLANPVSAVLLNFRAFDTLLEKAVLVLALAGLWVLSAGIAQGRLPANFESRHEVEPQLVVLLKVLVPLVLITALYLLWLGADEPGGAFQSGTILAAVAILLVLARVMPVPVPTSVVMRCAVAAGFLVFAAAGFYGMAGEGAFLTFPTEGAKSIILLVEVALTVSVAAVLFLLASGLPNTPDRGGSR